MTFPLILRIYLARALQPRRRLWNFTFPLLGRITPAHTSFRTECKRASSDNTKSWTRRKAKPRRAGFLSANHRGPTSSFPLLYKSYINTIISIAGQSQTGLGYCTIVWLYYRVTTTSFQTPPDELCAAVAAKLCADLQLE